MTASLRERTGRLLCASCGFQIIGASKWRPYSIFHPECAPVYEPGLAPVFAPASFPRMSGGYNDQHGCGCWFKETFGPAGKRTEHRCQLHKGGKIFGKLI